MPHNPHQILKVRMILHTLHVIAMFTLPMLLIWHLSTAFQLEHFDMPDFWQRDYRNPQVRGWGACLWALMFLLVAMDLGYALCALDRVHAEMNKEKGLGTLKRKGGDEAVTGQRNKSDHDGAAMAEAGTENSNSTPPPPKTSASSGLENPEQDISPPQSKIRNLLTNATFHIFAISLYIAHILCFAYNLQPSFDTCFTNRLRIEWAFYNSIHSGRQLSFEDRCKRINWSVWVSGGFSSAGAMILILLHLVTLGTRVWAFFSGDPEPRKERHLGKREAAEDGAGNEKDWHVRPRDVDIKPRGEHQESARPRSSGAMSTLSQEESGLRRRRDMKTSSKDRSRRDSGDEGWKTDAAWNEALLEFLVP